MKKTILTIVMALMCALTFAQNADFQKAVAKYKNVSSLTATATRVTHKDAVAKDKVEKGKLYVKKPAKVLIVNGADMLKMNGTLFTFKKGVLKANTDSNKNPQYKTFHDVLESIFSGGTKDLTKYPEVKITKSGSNVVVTITPKTNGKKAMFSSYVITIDSKTSEMTSLRMNQKGGYTEYNFSGYSFGAAVADKLF